MTAPMIQGPLWEVTVIEYDDGAQRHCPELTRIFSREQDAEAYAREQNQGSPQCYWRAQIRQFG